MELSVFIFYTDERVEAIANSLGLTAIIWNFDFGDWRLCDDPSLIDEGQAYSLAFELARNWKSAGGGVISLEHDLCSASVGKAREVIRGVLDAGMNIKRVGDCL